MGEILAETLKSLLMAAHLLAMNLASAGPLFCMLLAHRASSGDLVAGRVGRRLAWWNVAALLVGVALGTLTLFIPPTKEYFEVLQRIPVRGYWFAGLELLFSLVCLVVYASTWNSLRQYRWLQHLVALMTVTNLLYHFPPLMTVIAQEAAGTMRSTTEVLDRAALLRLMFLPEGLAPWIHFVLGSIAVSGVLALVAMISEIRSGENSIRSARAMAAIALGVTLLQLPVGLWLLTTVSEASRSALMGGNPMAALAFLAAMLGVYLLIRRLATVVWGDFDASDLRTAAVLMIVVVLLMTVSMRVSRRHRTVDLSEAPTQVGREALGFTAHK